MAEKILVIDDEPLILMTIEKALGRVGYEVRTTPDAESFIEALSAGDYDLLIMDLHLDGKDTDALTEKAKEVSPRSKILVISGAVSELSGRCFLQKPFRIDELRQMVREMLDGP